MNTILRNIIVTFFLGMVVLFFNVSWIVPIFSERAHPNYQYLPIHYYPDTFDDDYFYYSRIRETIDGKIFSGDHATIEHKSDSTPHATYTISFVFGSLGAFFSGKTQHAYYFNHIFFPALIFVAFLMLGNAVGLNVFLSTALGSFILLYNTHFNRTPNSLITSSFLLFLALLFFHKFELKKSSRFFDILIIALLGSSSLISTPNFFISYGLFFTFLVFYQKSIVNWKGWIKICVLSILLSSPGIYILLKSIFIGNSDFFNYAIPPLDMYHGFKFYVALAALRPFLSFPAILALLIPSAIILLFNFRHKFFYITILVAYFLVYIFLTLADGSFLAAYVFKRGGEALFCFIVGGYSLQFLSSLILEGQLQIVFIKKNLLSYFKKIFENKKWKLTMNSLFVFALVFPGLKLYEQIQYKSQYALQTKAYYNLPEVSQLADWAVAHVTPPKAAVTLDFDLVINLGIYTPIDTYLAFAHASPVSTPERNRRFFETLAFFGQDEAFLRNILTQMIGHPSMSRSEPEKINLGLMQLIQFYGMYSDRKMPPNEIEALVTEFKNMQPISTFTYQADYFIVSPECQTYVKEGSAADQIIRTSTPIYENSKYRIYQIHKGGTP